MKKFSSLLAAALCLCLLFPVLIGCNPTAVDGGDGNKQGGETTQTGTSDDNTLTVMFNSNGGNAIAPQTVERGQFAETPTVPVRFGYIFDGWQTADGTEWAFDKQAVTENVTLIAKWRESGVSLSVRNVNDVIEEILNPYEEQILAFFNYEFITTHFSTFVNTTDPEANEVYKRLDDLQIKEDPQEFKADIDEILGTPSALDKNRNDNVCSRFRYDYKNARNKIRADLNSSDPAVVAAAEELEREMLEQIRLLNPTLELPLPSESVVAKLLNDVYKGFGTILAIFEPMIQYNVSLQIDLGEATAEETLRDGMAHTSFEYEGRLLPSVPYNPGEPSAISVQTAAAPENWYTVVNRDASEDPGETEYVPLSSFSGYVIRKTLTFSVPGTTDAGCVAAFASIKGKGAAILILTDAGLFFNKIKTARPFINQSSELGLSSGWKAYGGWFQNEGLSRGYLRLPAGELMTVDLYVYVDGSDPEYFDRERDAQEHVSVEIFFAAADYESYSRSKTSE